MLPKRQIKTTLVCFFSANILSTRLPTFVSTSAIFRGSSLSFTGPPLFNQIALLSVNVDVTGSGQIGHSPLCNMAGADKSPVEMLIKMATPAIKSD